MLRQRTKGMSPELMPFLYYSAITKVQFRQIMPINKLKFVLVDVDNTLLRCDEYLPDREIRDMFLALRYEGTVSEFCLLSNTILSSREERVWAIARFLEVPAVCCDFFRRKPHPWGFLRAMEYLGAEPGNTVMIGDQIRTDVVGAHRAGIRSILVDPLGPELWITKHRRRFERPIREYLRGTSSACPGVPA